VRSISETAGQELLWIQPAAFQREHELRGGDDVVATLKFQRGSLADAETADGYWTFKRQGFWQPRVTVRAAGSDADLATFILWQSVWVRQENEKPLIRIKGRHGLIKANGAVEITPDAANIPDTALLVLLGWYLILLHAEDSAAATSVSAAAASSS